MNFEYDFALLGRQLLFTMLFFGPVFFSLATFYAILALNLVLQLGSTLCIIIRCHQSNKWPARSYGVYRRSGWALYHRKDNVTCTVSYKLKLYLLSEVRPNKKTGYSYNCVLDEVDYYVRISTSQ